MTERLQDKFIKNYGLPTLIVLFVISDLSAYFFPDYAPIPLCLWIILVACYVFSGIWAFGKIIRMPATLSVILLNFGMVIYYILSSDYINGESAQQLGCILWNLTEEKQLGFYTYCFIGYPARQFYLPALPSLLFGRSAESLNAGYMIGLFVSLPIAAYGLSRFFEKLNKADWVVALLLSISGLFYRYNYLLVVMEQSIFPYYLSLGALGFYLLYLSSRNMNFIWLLAIVGILSVHSYTPALSVLAAILAIFLLNILISFHPETLMRFIRIKGSEYLPSGLFVPGWQATALIFLITVELIISFILRIDVTFGTDQPSLAVQRAVNGIVNVYMHDEGRGLASYTVTALISLLVISGFLYVYQFCGFLLSGWILVTLTLAIAMKGYAYPALDLSLHRFTVAIPALMLLGGLTFVRFRIFCRPHKLLFACLIAWVSYLGISDQLERLSERGNADNMALVNYLRSEGLFKDQKLLIISKPLTHDYGSAADFFQYFRIPQFSKWEESDCRVISENLQAGNKFVYVSLDKKNGNDQSEPCSSFTVNASSYKEARLIDNDLKFYFFNP